MTDQLEARLTQLHDMDHADCSYQRERNDGCRLMKHLREAARIGAEEKLQEAADYIEATFARYDVAHALRNLDAIRARGGK